MAGGRGANSARPRQRRHHRRHNLSLWQESRLQQDEAVPHHKPVASRQTPLPGWADKDHAAESHSCPPGAIPQTPAQVPWQQMQSLCLGGQCLPFSRLKITSIWQAQGHPPSKYFHLLPAEMDGNGLAFSSAAEEPGASLWGFSPPCSPHLRQLPEGCQGRGVSLPGSWGSSLGKEP